MPTRFTCVHCPDILFRQWLTNDFETGANLTKLQREQENAETLALQALGWIAANDELLPVFLGASGLRPDELGRRAGEPEVLASVLDFLLMDDAWVIAFCDAAGLGYDRPRQARHALPGATPDW